MLFKPDDNDDRLESDEPNDFFENTPPVEEKPKPKPQPRPKPDDPDYWDREEPEFEYISRTVRRRRLWVWAATILVVLAAVTAFYLRFFSPYIDDAVQYGYVESIHKQGTIFKTYEGVLLPYKELHDTTRLYSRDFTFTAENAHIAAQLMKMQLAGLPVTVKYRRYHATLPWRGETKTIIFDVDTADPARILPPEFNLPRQADK